MIPYLTLLIGLCLGFLAGWDYKRRDFKVSFNEPEPRITVEASPASPVQFIESISPREKFANAKDVSDLIQ